MSFMSLLQHVVGGLRGVHSVHGGLEQLRQAHDRLEHLLLHVLLSRLQMLEGRICALQCSLPLLM